MAKSNATKTKAARPAKASGGEPRGPRDERRERTRMALIESGIKVFSAVGYDAAQTRTIAARAHVNHGLVHYHFSSKFKLWKACLDHLYALSESKVLSDGEVLDYEDMDGRELEFMRGVIRGYVTYAARHPELARFFSDVVRSRGPRLDYLIERHGLSRVEWLQELFRRLQQQGHIPRISPLILHYMLWGMANTIFTLAAEVKRKVGIDPTKDEDLIEEQIRAIEIMFFGDKLPGKSTARITLAMAFSI